MTSILDSWIKRFWNASDEQVREAINNTNPTGPQPLASNPKSNGNYEEMRKNEFRMMMKKMGIDIEGQDVCHIIAESNQGANAKDNYFMCSAQFNRRIGNRGDALNCYLVGLDRCRAAVASSVIYNDYKGPSADELFAHGSQSFQRIMNEVLEPKRPAKNNNNNNNKNSNNNNNNNNKNNNKNNNNSNKNDTQAIQMTTTDLLFASIDEILTCHAVIQTGARKGMVCGRTRPCRYHDKE